MNDLFSGGGAAMGFGRSGESVVCWGLISTEHRNKQVKHVQGMVVE